MVSWCSSRAGCKSGQIPETQVQPSQIYLSDDQVIEIVDQSDNDKKNLFKFHFVCVKRIKFLLVHLGPSRYVCMVAE